MRHLSYNGNRGIGLSSQSYIYGNKTELNNLFSASRYVCGSEVNYDDNVITFYEQQKIEFPISQNETIILKSMSERRDPDDCSILTENYSKAKPLQFPYNTFSELSSVEVRSPFSLFLAHLYYKHNTTNEGSFKDIINECCDIIDKELMPSCSNVTKIKFRVGECVESSKKIYIEYINCINDVDLSKDIDCSYLPVTYSLGLIIQIYVTMAYIIDFLLYIVQITLLIIWSFTQKGVIMKRYYLDNIGDYELEDCSTGNEYILSSMFIIDFGLLVISIIVAFNGRKILVVSNMTSFNNRNSVFKDFFPESETIS
ncbi:hypothetical protein PIROE2DRAFT_1976 [Piromyces sp. E2]|nr:hypothetical protein PIROE2DRAFT_1976 [Piromyces sp. E2]|eukprot:OUM70027.1 hypothetical protein PIROE2DRAFT_1976 [Piromyces sp. E2]